MTTTDTTTSLPLVAGTWALDANHSSVGFTIRHLGVSKVRGRFNDFTVDAVVGETLEATSVSALVQLASVDTGNGDRDAHVQAPDMIDVATRPTMAFRSIAIAPDGADWAIDGEVTIGEVTRPLRLVAELGGIETFADGSRHAGFEARGEIKRSDFGIAPGVPSAMLGDVVKFELDLQLVEPTA
jgi:polyisoprenoid-binding protein YceI